MVNTMISSSPSQSVSTPPNNKSQPTTGTRSTSGKKLKQTRLPFKILNSPSALEKQNNVAVKEAESLAEGRKRKLSSPEAVEEARNVKIGRNEAGPNAKSSDNNADITDKAVIVPEPIEIDDEEESLDAEENTVSAMECVSVVFEESSNSTDATKQDQSLELPQTEENEAPPAAGSVEPDLADTFPAEPPPNANGKPLTSRQIEKFMEKKRKHEEKMRLKRERERKAEEDRRLKEERERQRQREREEKEEQKRKEKEEKEEQRRKEKEEKDMQKQREKEDRERKKQQEAEQREEERRLKEEEKRKREQEEEAKKKRTSDKFTKFFKANVKALPTNEEEKSEDAASLDANKVEPVFMPFAVKGDMKLAPLVRRQLKQEERDKLELLFVVGDTRKRSSVDVQGLYIKSLKTRQHVPLKSTKTWVSTDSESDDDLMVIGDELAHKVEENKPKEKFRVKFLSFHENRRPAYYGTWQKKSVKIGPRRPLGKDEKFFDYEVDSDDEWEEEEPGESLHGSEDEKDKESEDDYEVDNEFFVPHGHLSDEEMKGAADGEGELEDNSPETQKLRLKLLQDEFNDEMKKKTEKIKPRVIGCMWVEAAGERPPNCPAIFWELLQARAALSDGPIVALKPAPADKAAEDDVEGMADTEEVDNTRKKINLPEAEVCDLIKLVHGNLNQAKFLVKEFQEYRAKRQHESKPESMRQVTNMSILRRIKELAKWESSAEMFNHCCWIVQPAVLEQYQMQAWPVMNTWQYTLTPKRTFENVRGPEKREDPPGGGAGAAVTGSSAGLNGGNTATASSGTPTVSSVPHHGSIQKFAKVLTSAEKQKQFEVTRKQAVGGSSQSGSGDKPVGGMVQQQKENGSDQQKSQSMAGVKKRVPLLMSVGRGEAISEQSKNMLIKNYLQKIVPAKGVVEEQNAQTPPPPPRTLVNSEPIVLD